MTTTLNAPNLFSDETLYSYLSRVHYLWGASNPRNTSKDWFAKQGMSIDQRLPIGLGMISNSTGYSLAHLLQNHTCFPLYQYFCPELTKLESTLKGVDGTALANVSQSAKMGMKTRHQFCPKCAEDDCDVHGIAYWHLSHQIWGVRTCCAHHCELVAQKASPRQYELPSLNQNIATQPVSQDWMTFTTYMVEKLKESRIKTAHGALLKQTHLLSEIEERGLLKGSKHINMATLLHHINAYAEKLDLPPFFTDTTLRHVIKNGPASAHPFKSLFLMFVLKQLDYYHQPSAIVASNIRPAGTTDYVQLLKEEGSLRAVARKTGKNLSSLRVIAKANKIKIDERRQRITIDIEKQIIEMCVEGIHREIVANKFKISKGAVEQIIQTVDGLSSRRKLLRVNERKRHARGALLMYLSNHPNSTRKHVRSNMNADYMWLYKHDKTWLFENLPQKQVSAYHGGVLWAKRDAELIVEMSVFLKDIFAATQKLPSLQEVDIRFGSHTWFTRSIDKLPRCKLAYTAFMSEMNITD